jgi:hypothetical protein
VGVTATYNGPYTKGYLQYVDEGSNGHTLVAVPGGSYFVALASGWAGLLATPPADGLWSASTFSPVLLSGVPGFASPGAFVLGSPGTARPSGGDEGRLEAARVEVAPETEDAGLRRDGWAEGDIRRRRKRQRLLARRGAVTTTPAGTR